MWPWAQSWRKRVNDGEMGGAGRSQSMWHFADLKMVEFISNIEGEAFGRLCTELS